MAFVGWCALAAPSVAVRSAGASMFVDHVGENPLGSGCITSLIHEPLGGHEPNGTNTARVQKQMYSFPCHECQQAKAQHTLDGPTKKCAPISTFPLHFYEALFGTSNSASNHTSANDKAKIQDSSRSLQNSSGRSLLACSLTTAVLL